MSATLSDLATALSFPSAPTHLLPTGPYRVRVGEPNQIGAVGTTEFVSAALSRLSETPAWSPSEPEVHRVLTLHRALGRPTLELRLGATPSVHVVSEGRWPRITVWEALASRLSDGVRRAYEDVLMASPVTTVTHVGAEVDLRSDSGAFTLRFARGATPDTADRIAGELDGLAADLGVLSGSRAWLGDAWRSLSRIGPREIGLQLTLTPGTLRQELVVEIPDVPLAAVRAMRRSLSRVDEDPALDPLLALLPPPGGLVAGLVLKVAAQGAPTASVELR
jgi:hypothetical protein